METSNNEGDVAVFDVKYISQGRLLLTKTAVATPFFCVRCQRDKKAKLMALWTQGEDSGTTTICNGCYGNILAEEGIV